jgi:hypothetical protein
MHAGRAVGWPRSPPPLAVTAAKPSSVRSPIPDRPSAPPSRHRYLKELGVEAEQVNLDLKDAKEHKKPEFLKVNPFGKVPAMSDGGFNLVSSPGRGAAQRGARGAGRGRGRMMYGPMPQTKEHILLAKQVGVPNILSLCPLGPLLTPLRRHPLLPVPPRQFESGALLMYLADKFPLQSGILTPQQRAAASQWVLFANSTLAK